MIDFTENNEKIISGYSLYKKSYYGRYSMARFEEQIGIERFMLIE